MSRKKGGGISFRDSSQSLSQSIAVPTIYERRAYWPIPPTVLPYTVDASGLWYLFAVNRTYRIHVFTGRPNCIYAWLVRVALPMRPALLRQLVDTNMMDTINYVDPNIPIGKRELINVGGYLGYDKDEPKKLASWPHVFHDVYLMDHAMKAAQEKLRAAPKKSILSYFAPIPR